MTLMIGCIGVVYGDIGTSPLYAMRESLHAVKEDGIDNNEILGVISLLVWALIIVVTLKYVFFLMRADNKGEGGTLSLMALVKGAMGKNSGSVITLGMIGAALFYGDAMLTPAISVLSAVEGLKLVTPVFEPYIIMITLGIIVGLFWMQSRGTASVAKLFGPITIVWFIAIAAVAVPHILQYPEVLKALYPWYAFEFLFSHGMLGFIVLGSVFLAVTGAEALYADMGHFGRKPIKRAWLWFVFPCLVINYLGQGALILHQPDAVSNPFFLLAPSWALLPLVLLATVATVIASQAVITGAFSLTQQAIQLGFLPRLEIRHTSDQVHGQIYMPQVNFLLLIGVIMLVLGFKNSSALASAYGIAVTGTMLVDTVLAFYMLRIVWKKPLWMTLAIIIPFFIIDSAFLGANLLKVMDGGYVPLLMGLAMVYVMATWVKGSRILSEKTHKESVPLVDLMKMIERSSTLRVPGTAVFLTNQPDVAPTSLMHNWKHNKVIHQHNVIMTVRIDSAPKVAYSKRVVMEQLSDSISKVTLHFGYMEMSDIPKALTQCRKHGLNFDIMSTSFFLGRRTIKPSARSGMPLWQDHLFILLARNASAATDFFHIPQGRVVELGSQITV